MILITLIAPSLFKTNSVVNNDGLEAFNKEVEEFLNDTVIVNNEIHIKDSEEKLISKKTSRYKPVKFNPNSLDINGWMKMGFSKKQADVILKYKYKIGRFSCKEDFQNIYIINDDVYKIFEPFLDIGPVLEEKYEIKQRENTVRKPIYKVELNSADSIELVKVRGIGPVFAVRIIEYRQKLQGFSHVRQLEEIYGMDSTKVADLSDQVFIDTTLIMKININTASLSELRAHPYISYYTAKAIIDKRIQSGNITSVNQLQRVGNITIDLFNKIKPYLSVN